MTFSRLLYLFSLNTVMALGAFFGILTVGEYLVPGFASPFIDVVHLGLVVLASSVLLVLLKPDEMGRPGFATRAWQGMAVALALVAGGVLLWANSVPGSLSDLGLLGAYAVLSLVFFIATVLAL